MLRAAIYTALSRKLSDGELKIIDSLQTDSYKTKELATRLTGLFNQTISALLIPAIENKKIFRAAANLPKVKSSHASSLNVEDILKYKNILLDQKAVSEIK